MTPVIEKINHDLSNRYVELEREKLTRFMMARASNRDLEITDCRGARISAGLGFVYEGQLRSLYWSFIRPCLEDTIQECCDAVEKALPTYNRRDRAKTLDALQGALNGFVGRIYRHIVDMDRRMRGKGDPTSVKPYDPASEITYAREIIAHTIVILRRHYLPPAWQEFWAKYWHWIVGAVAVPVLGFIIRALAG